MDVSPAKKSYFTCVNVWWKLLFHSTFFTLGFFKQALEYFQGYCSLVTFREVFFVNKVHKKPENCGAKSCECMISVHREARYCERSEQ